jgi:hypothetical protein
MSRWNSRRMSQALRRSALSYQGRKAASDAPVVEWMKELSGSIRATAIVASASFSGATATT